MRTLYALVLPSMKAKERCSLRDKWAISGQYSVPLRALSRISSGELMSRCPLSSVNHGVFGSCSARAHSMNPTPTSPVNNTVRRSVISDSKRERNSLMTVL